MTPDEVIGKVGELVAIFRTPGTLVLGSAQCGKIADIIEAMADGLVLGKKTLEAAKSVEGERDARDLQDAEFVGACLTIAEPWVGDPLKFAVDAPPGNRVLYALDVAAREIKEHEQALAGVTELCEQARKRLEEVGTELTAERARAEKAEQSLKISEDVEAHATAQRHQTLDLLEGRIARLTERAEKAERERDATENRLAEWLAPYDQAIADFVRNCCRALELPETLSLAQYEYETQKMRARLADLERGGWLVVRAREQYPIEAWQFKEESEARAFFGDVSAMWTETFLCCVAAGPGKPQASIPLHPLQAEVARLREKLREMEQAVKHLPESTAGG